MTEMSGQGVKKETGAQAVQAVEDEAHRTDPITGFGYRRS